MLKNLANYIASPPYAQHTMAINPLSRRQALCWLSALSFGIYVLPLSQLVNPGVRLQTIRVSIRAALLSLATPTLPDKFVTVASGSQDRAMLLWQTPSVATSS